VKPVVMPDSIIRCPHEAATVYPERQLCSLCPVSGGRNRRTGDLLPQKPAR
jgi:hypothetical protein